MVIIIMSFRIAFKLLKLIVNYYNMYYYSLIINPELFMTSGSCP